ncbi:hypothetical protein FQN54_005126 [Arachnomyces sp. PD_36]|nr:hypothetical protein FQN54_005126 [Arachnomyces sp. PD_36]
MADSRSKDLFPKLTPGHHSFVSPTSNLTFTYLVRGNHILDNANNINRLIIIQCPGWGLGSTYLQIGLAPLEQHFSLLYFHPRGTCGSQKPEDGTQMGSLIMARDLEDLRVYLSIEKFPALLGHSNGGTIALAYAEEFPERVERLVLLSHRVLGVQDEPVGRRLGGGEGEEQENDTAEDKIPPELRPIVDRELTDAWVNVLPMYFVDQACVAKFTAAMGDTPTDGWCLTKQKRCDRQPGVGQWMISHLGDVKANVLSIVGKQDIICPVANAERTERDVSNAETVLLDDCGHFPWIEKEIETFEAIATFLRQRT